MMSNIKKVQVIDNDRSQITVLSESLREAGNCLLLPMPFFLVEGFKKLIKVRFPHTGEHINYNLKSKHKKFNVYYLDSNPDDLLLYMYDEDLKLKWFKIK